ncbi:MAG: T9SS type A sorting domain-containing protein [Flavobacterium sp.]|nr:T9SS type A sorting domain-containing protein [Flavobacterium sp.]
MLATHQAADFRIDNLSSGMHVMKITTSEGAIHKNFIKK